MKTLLLTISLILAATYPQERIVVTEQGSHVFTTCENERQYSPETFIRPELSQFTTEAHYLVALDKFERNGNWITWEDGTECIN